MVLFPQPVDQDFSVFAQAPVHPLQAVRDLEACKTQGDPHQVLRPRPREHQRSAAGLEHSVDFPPDLRAGHPAIPIIPHEAALLGPVLLTLRPGHHAGCHVGGLVIAQAVGRVRDHAIHAGIRQSLEHVDAVPADDISDGQVRGAVVGRGLGDHAISVADE